LFCFPIAGKGDFEMAESPFDALFADADAGVAGSLIGRSVCS
jgi:hypothetical protein